VEAMIAAGRITRSTEQARRGRVFGARRDSA
jgi:hypothetical protein